MSIDRATEQEIKDSIENMPALVQTAKLASRICESRRVDALRLYKIISIDPILFCQTQMLYHYYYPKQRGEFTSIAKIIIILNVNTIKNYILRFAVKTKTVLEAKGWTPKMIEAQETFFLHATASAAVSRHIAKKLGINEDLFELYYAAGLLHDIGKFFNTGSEDHCVTGSFAANHIGLAKSLNHVISYHHDIEHYKGRNAHLVCTVMLADYIVHKYIHFKDYPREKNELDNKVLKTLHVDEAFCKVTASEIESEIKHIWNFAKAGR